MAAYSDYLKNKLIDHLFRSSTFSKPSALAIALCTVAPVDSDTGALTGKEVTNANGYARVAVSPSDSNWEATQGGIVGDSSGTTGITRNVNSVVFPAATGSGWGTITHVAIVDNSTYGAGNLLLWGALDNPEVVNSGDNFQFSVSALAIEIDN
jgi:hypothetical protein